MWSAPPVKKAVLPQGVHLTAMRAADRSDRQEPAIDGFAAGSVHASVNLLAGLRTANHDRVFECHCFFSPSGINPRLGNANIRSGMYPAIIPILADVEGHRQAKPDSAFSCRFSCGPPVLPGRLAGVFLVASGILGGGRVIGSGAAKRQYSVGQSAQERAVMRDEAHGSFGRLWITYHTMP